MRWLLTFLAGAVLGAGSLFLYLHQIGRTGPAPEATVATVATVTPAIPPDPGLPTQPMVSTDLSEANLPLRPGASELAVPPIAAADEKAGAKLRIPVEGIKLAQLSDNFDQPRGSERHHEALDIMAPKGTKVLAVADGKVAKLFNSKPGGLTVYQFDPSSTYAYYYAHLDKYADGIKEGMEIKRGDLIGYVGVTGNASPDAPHLHFAVVQLTPEKQWWKGTPVNPFPLMGD